MNIVLEWKPVIWKLYLNGSKTISQWHQVQLSRDVQFLRVRRLQKLKVFQYFRPVSSGTSNSFFGVKLILHDLQKLNNYLLLFLIIFLNATHPELSHLVEH